jgi:hypothetical protein
MMNERIEKLIDDAKLTAVSEMFEDELKKFAELIVQECAELFPRTFTDEQYQRRIDKTIRKHFGVEL